MTDLDAEIAALEARLKEVRAERQQQRDKARKRAYYRRNAEREKARSAAYRADPRTALFRKLRRHGVPLAEARAEVARAFAMEAAE